jgi:hypothetical protein
LSDSREAFLKYWQSFAAMLAWVFFLAAVVIAELFSTLLYAKTISCRIENQFDDEISGYKSFKPKSFQKLDDNPAKDLEDSQFALFQPILV